MSPFSYCAGSTCNTNITAMTRSVQHAKPNPWVSLKGPLADSIRHPHTQPMTALGPVDSTGQPVLTISDAERWKSVLPHLTHSINWRGDSPEGRPSFGQVP